MTRKFFLFCSSLSVDLHIATIKVRPKLKQDLLDTALKNLTENVLAKKRVLKNMKIEKRKLAQNKTGF